MHVGSRVSVASPCHYDPNLGLATSVISRPLIANRKLAHDNIFGGKGAAVVLPSRTTSICIAVSYSIASFGKMLLGIA